MLLKESPGMSEKNDPLEFIIAEATPWNGRNSEACIFPLLDGRLVLTWSHWTHGSQHDHAPAEIRAKFSSDLGGTWSDSILWQGHGHYHAVEDPSLARLPSGKIGFCYFARLGEQFGNEDHFYQSVFTFFRRSDDEGETWNDPIMMNPEGMMRTYTQLDTLRVSNSGRLIKPVCLLWRDPLIPDEVSRVLVLYSDDEGDTWKFSNGLVVEEARDFEAASEACAEQFSDGTWFMTIRNSTGRAFVSYSTDDGANWSKPEPAPLASSASPVMIRRIPDTDHLLTVWNQVSPNEIRAGHPRHRLSCAITKDRGKTWEHHRNLESQDTCRYVEPEAVEGPIIRPSHVRGHTPLTADDTDHELTGAYWTNCSYPSILFHEGFAFITYDVSNRDTLCSLKFRRIPMEWFYE